MTVTSDETITGVPAAWYPCPRDPRLLRWWDGLAWTEHTVEPELVEPEDPAASVSTDAGPVDAGPIDADVIDADVVDVDVIDADVVDVAPPVHTGPPVVAGQPLDTAALAQHAPPIASSARRLRVPGRRDPSSRERLPETGPIRPRSTYAPVQVDEAAVVAPASGITVWVWALAAVPLLQGAALAMVPDAAGWSAVALLVAPVLVALLVAHRDGVELRRRSLPTAGWAWAVTPLLYLVSRAIRVGRSTRWPFVAWAVVQIAVIAVAATVALPAYTAMTEVPRYDRAPWASASEAVLTDDERARLLTPAGMGEQILLDLRTDGSVVSDATCPEDVDTGDARILTCRVQMETVEADVRVQVTDGYPNVAFVILGFDYD